MGDVLMSAPVTIPAYGARHAAIFEAAYREAAMQQALRLLDAGLIEDAADALRKAMVFEVEQAA